MSLRITHVSPHIGSGGLGQAVPKLCSALAHRKLDVSLHVLGPTTVAAPVGVSLSVHPSRTFLGAFGVSPSLKQALHDAARNSALIHANSLWTMASVYPSRAVRGTACRYVFSPHGTLAQWALEHHKWRKKIIWALMQRAAIQCAHCFHVTSEKELDDVRRLGFKNKAAIIHNGIDIPKLGLAPPPAANAPRRLLFLGRLHPVKALDNLLRAWALLQQRRANANWELVVAGENEGGYLAAVQRLAAELKLERVSFPGLVRESERDALYQSAELFVLPSHTENFGLSAAEALANGVPAVISRHAPWKNIEREGCGWWSDNAPEALAACLGAAMSESSASLKSMGARGRLWMQRDFSWDRAAEMTEALYRWLIDGGNAPKFVV